MLAQAGCDIETRGRSAFMITKERLDELLAYDPETGHFTWGVRAGSRALVGTVAGSPNTNGHVHIGVDGKRYLAHRLAFLKMTGVMPDDQVDHINGVRDDNRWPNLRPATNAENGRNRRTQTTNTSGVPGVGWYARLGKWQAYIRVNYKHIHLGLFTEFEDAVAARRAAEVKYFGEFSATASRVDEKPRDC